MHQYQLSKDYAALYEAVKQGAVAVGFTRRTSVTIYRDKEGRGCVKSTNVYILFEQSPAGNEAAFVEMLNSLNLEFIPFNS